MSIIITVVSALISALKNGWDLLSSIIKNRKGKSNIVPIDSSGKSTPVTQPDQSPQCVDRHIYIITKQTKITEEYKVIEVTETH